MTMFLIISHRNHCVFQFPVDMEAQAVNGLVLNVFLIHSVYKNLHCCNESVLTYFLLQEILYNLSPLTTVDILILK